MITKTAVAVIIMLTAICTLQAKTFYRCPNTGCPAGWGNGSQCKGQISTTNTCKRFCMHPHGPMARALHINETKRCKITGTGYNNFMEAKQEDHKIHSRIARAEHNTNTTRSRLRKQIADAKVNISKSIIKNVSELPAAILNSESFKKRVEDIVKVRLQEERKRIKEELLLELKK